MSDVKSGPSCPDCGQPAHGNFCQNCGASLGGRFCNQCGEQIPAGAKFCNQCGAKASGAGSGASRTGGGASATRPGGSAGRRAVAEPAHKEAVASVVGGQNLPWWIAGVAMFALILFVGISMVRPAGPVPSTAAPAAGQTAGAPPDISNMSPIEAADRLFNRVMSAASEGDSLQAQSFMPMAIAAYQRARPLTLDGLFHLSMLNRTAMNLEAALDIALEIVEQDPNHLLGLAAAAEAAIERGELDEAEVHYRQIAEIYDTESQRALPEYSDHSRIVVVLKDDAERFLASR